ncbi:galactokinase [Parvularcula sp. IMCC14364]|uniref:galactokinase n=1 Tax=Parvularcula sp. IMCC14364 TaxID=3067902 RepID=UPI0027429339|nr:galactokinase [Parvularcula sp. IMCC14364]
MSIQESYERIYGASPVAIQQVPGRVNLIGEHTDYNGGLVLPTAINKSVSVAIGEAADDYYYFTSAIFPDPVRRDLSKIRTGHWSDYPLAAFAWLKAQGGWQKGAEVYIDSDLPHGSGLSSSAALIVAILKAVTELTGPYMTDTEVAKAAQRVENEYLAVPCGIMDQMAVAVARPGQALLLNTETLAFELIELPHAHSFVVAHSGVYRRLDEGRYALRRRECDAAAAALGVKLLCHLTEESAKGLIPKLEQPMRQRARHVWTEHCRVQQAASALRAHELEELGQLMTESHHSMRDDFEISLPVIDEMVDCSRRFGALGARLTGGGFGGCFVSLVETAKVDDWQQRMLQAFPEITFV